MDALSVRPDRELTVNYDYNYTEKSLLLTHLHNIKRCLEKLITLKQKMFCDTID